FYSCLSPAPLLALTHPLSLHDPLPILYSPEFTLNPMWYVNAEYRSPSESGQCSSRITSMSLSLPIPTEATVTLRRSGSCTGLTQDRKSTRLNSSHRTISYAVFCLKKKR